MKNLPGWQIQVEEVFGGVHRATLRNLAGKIAEAADTDKSKAMILAFSAAFDIEKKTSSNWSMFLYDLCQDELRDLHILKQQYNDKAFGSWLIELEAHRIIYMGKDFWLVLQFRSGKNWLDGAILSRDELTYPILISMLKATK
jgi:hypothetical protein